LPERGQNCRPKKSLRKIDYRNELILKPKRKRLWSVRGIPVNNSGIMISDILIEQREESSSAQLGQWGTQL
jgi:hypothetical protein